MGEPPGALGEAGRRRGAGVTGIAAALARELAALLPRLEDRQRSRGPEGWLVTGRLAGTEVAVTATGDGAAAGRRGLAALLDRFPVQRLLLLGVGGGLSPELEEGALVAGRTVRFPTGEVPPPDRDWLGRTAGCGAALLGTVVTAERILGGPGEKTELWRRLATGGPATVDLESAHWALEAARREVPYLAVRAVLDPAAEELPLDFETCRGADGRVRTGRVLLAALVRPGRFAALAGLRGRLDRCSQRLAGFAERAVAA